MRPGCSALTLAADKHSELGASELLIDQAAYSDVDPSDGGVSLRKCRIRTSALTRAALLRVSGVRSSASPGHDHIDFAAAAFGADQPPTPIEQGRFGDVTSSHLSGSKRSTGRGRRQRCRASWAGRGRISTQRVACRSGQIPHNQFYSGESRECCSAIALLCEPGSATGVDQIPKFPREINLFLRLSVDQRQLVGNLGVAV